MTSQEVKKAVAELDAISGADPEIAHNEADRILLRSVPQEVEDAYRRLRERCSWWATA